MDFFRNKRFWEAHRIDSRELLGYLDHQRHDDGLPVLRGGEKLPDGDFLLTRRLLLLFLHLSQRLHRVTLSSEPFNTEQGKKKKINQ